MANLCMKFEGKDSAKTYRDLAEKVKKSFNEKFINKNKKCLYDVLGDDKIRPNQLYSLSLSYQVIDTSSEEAIEIINTVEEELMTPYGLRTLARGEKNYVAEYQGDVNKRDRAYHQGITWVWLLGLYYDSLKNIILNTKSRESKKELTTKLEEFIQKTKETFYEEMNTRSTICSISEIYDSCEPYNAKGAFAQAWSIAEVFRIITDK